MHCWRESEQAALVQAAAGALSANKCADSDHWDRAGGPVPGRGAVPGPALTRCKADLAGGSGVLGWVADQRRRAAGVAK